MVSILLLAHNKLELTRECIGSIYEHTDLSIFELIVVDNASDDGTSQYLFDLTRQHKNIRTIYNKENLSFAKACNQGARITQGDYLLFLNNDTKVTPNWLDEMIHVFQSEEKVGVVGGKLVYPNGKIQHAGAGISLWNGLPCHVGVNFEMDDPLVCQTKKVFAVTGACMMIRRGLFFDCEGFDEEYIYGYEDIDLCMKVSQLGYNIFYAPKSLVYHYESASFTYARKLEIQLINETLFRSRWRRIIEFAAGAYLDQLNREGVLRVLIYGTGKGGETIYSLFNENGFEVLGFMDSDEKKWGESFLGKRIFSPSEAKTLMHDAILIGSQFIDQIKATLGKNGIRENIIVPIVS